MIPVPAPVTFMTPTPPDDPRMADEVERAVDVGEARRVEDNGGGDGGRAGGGAVGPPELAQQFVESVAAK